MWCGRSLINAIQPNRTTCFVSLMQTIRIQWIFICFKDITDRNKRTPLGIASKVIKSGNLYRNCAEVIVLMYGINAACCFSGAGYLFSEHGHGQLLQNSRQKIDKASMQQGRVIRPAPAQNYEMLLYITSLFFFSMH